MLKTMSLVLFDLLLIVVLLGCLIGNVLIVGAIVKSHRLRERPGTYIVCSLALVDGFFMPAAIVYQILLTLSIGLEACIYFATYITILTYVSILHLLLLSVDRFVAVVKPFHYEELLKPCRCVYLLISAWFLPVLSVSIVPLFIKGYGEGRSFRAGLVGCQSGVLNSTNATMISNSISSAQQKHVTINSVLMVIFPFIAIIVLNSKIAYISYKQVKKNIPIGQLTQAEIQNNEKRVREMKWAKTIGIVIGAFAVTYIPLFACVAVHSRNPQTIPQYVFKFLEFLIFLNSAFNAVIYSIRSEEYRRAIKMIFKTVMPNAVTNFGSLHVGPAAASTAQNSTMNDTSFITMESSIQPLESSSNISEIIINGTNNDSDNNNSSNSNNNNNNNREQ